MHSYLCVYHVYEHLKRPKFCSVCCPLILIGSEEARRVNLLLATPEGITPLHDAVTNNQTEIAKLLLQHGGKYTGMLH